MDNLEPNDLNSIEEIDDDLLFDDELLADAGLTAFETTVDGFLSIASVDAVFGEPVEHANMLVIPAAEVGAAMGFGVGSGGGGDEKGSSGTGGGGGGGGWNFARPVAVIVITSDGVRVDPVIDLTKVAIATLTTVGFMFGMVSRMMRPRR